MKNTETGVFHVRRPQYRISGTSLTSGFRFLLTCLALLTLLLSAAMSAAASQDKKSDSLIAEGTSLTPASWRIPEKNVPVHTKGKKEASVMLGSRRLICYGQTKQKGGFKRYSGCGYCAAASLIGLIQNRKVDPIEIQKLNKDRYNTSYKSICRALEAHSIKYVYIKNHKSRSETIKLMKSCLKEHRPVICYVGGKWASSGYHYVLLVGFTDKDHLLVADSARDRSWSGEKQRFKLVKWKDFKKYIHGIHSSKKHVQYTTVKSMPEKWGRTASAGAQPGFITTAEAAY